MTRAARFRLATLAVGLLLSCALLECGVRVFDAVRGRSWNARSSWFWAFEQDPLLGYRGRPHVETHKPGERERHDAEGFRDDRDFADLARLRGSGKRLIVCVGESSTYGMSASSNAHTYPAQLERALREQSGDERWVVFNAGVPGYTSHEILELVKLRLLKLEPEIVLTMNLRNDLEFVARYLDDRQDYDFYPLRLAPYSATTTEKLLMRSAAYALLRGRLRSVWPDDLGGSVPQINAEVTGRGLRFYQDNLALLGELCRRSGVRLMFVDQPINDSGYDPAKRQALATMRRALAESCAQSGVPLLEAQTRLDWTGLPHDEVHLGDLGYERLARLLAPQIVELSSGSPAAPGQPPRTQ